MCKTRFRAHFIFFLKRKYDAICKRVRANKVSMGRSRAQIAQSRANMAKLHSGNKENINPASGNSSDGNSSDGDSHNEDSEAPQALRTARIQLLELKRKLHNTRRKLTRAEASKVDLRAQAKQTASDAESSHEKLGRAEKIIDTLRKAKNTLRMRVTRASRKQDVAVEKSKSHVLKEKGVFKENIREMTRELTSICRVPVARVDSVIQTVAKGLGIAVEDSMDKHSVSRITLEGQVAADMQLVHEIHNAGGMIILFLFNYIGNYLSIT
jgi:chromosome segregation ATPase